jgi:hypothetical protein
VTRWGGAATVSADDESSRSPMAWASTHPARRSGEDSAGKATLKRAHSRWAVRSLTPHSAAYSAWVGQRPTERPLVGQGPDEATDGGGLTHRLDPVRHTAGNAANTGRCVYQTLLIQPRISADTDCVAGLWAYVRSVAAWRWALWTAGVVLLFVGGGLHHPGVIGYVGGAMIVVAVIPWRSRREPQR